MAEKRGKRGEPAETELEQKWQSYAGTGINAKLKEQHLVLRQAFGEGDLFAIVLVKGELCISTPIKVLEEFKAGSLYEALVYFTGFASAKGAVMQSPKAGLPILGFVFQDT